MKLLVIRYRIVKGIQRNWYALCVQLKQGKISVDMPYLKVENMEKLTNEFADFFCRENPDNKHLELDQHPKYQTQ